MASPPRARVVRTLLSGLFAIALAGCGSVNPPSATPVGATGSPAAGAGWSGTASPAASAAASPAPSKVDPLSFPDRTVAPLAAFAVPGAGGLAATPDAVWSLGQGVLQRIDPATGRVTKKVTVPGPVASEVEEGLAWLTFGAGSLWATDFDTSTVDRLDPRTGATLATATVDHPEGIAAAPGGMWVASHRTGSLVLLDPATMRTLATVVVGPAGNSGPSGVWPIDGTLWTAVPNSNEIVAVDPATRAVAAKATGLPNPCGFLGEAVATIWVAECGRSVERVDVAADRYEGQVFVGGTVGVPQARPDGVWLPLAPPPNLTTPARMLKLGADGSPTDAVDLGPSCVPTLGPPSVLTAFGSIWVGCDNGEVLKLAPSALP